MAIQVTELFNRDGEYDLLGRAAFSRVFSITTDNRKTYQLTVLNAVYTAYGVQIGQRWSLGSPHEELNIYCTNVKITENAEGAGTEWLVTAFYEPVSPERLGLSLVPADLIDAPIVVTHGEWTENEALIFDKDGKVLTNSAGDILVAAEDWEVSYPLLTIVRYERNFNQVWAQEYRNTVNQNPLVIEGTTYPARTVRCKSIVGEEEWHQAIGRIYRVTYQLPIKTRVLLATDGTTVLAQGWDLIVANKGLRKKNSSGALEEIIDPASNFPVTEPVPLDETTGLPLSLPLAPTQTMPLRIFKVFREKNFDAFDFPSA